VIVVPAAQACLVWQRSPRASSSTRPSLLVGGANGVSNLQILCGQCNRVKSASS
jgi:5-methylcytosine-specific restriction endonuclease McrA